MTRTCHNLQQLDTCLKIVNVCFITRLVACYRLLRYHNPKLLWVPKTPLLLAKLLVNCHECRKHHFWGHSMLQFIFCPKDSQKSNTTFIGQTFCWGRTGFWAPQSGPGCRPTFASIGAPSISLERNGETYKRGDEASHRGAVFWPKRSDGGDNSAFSQYCPWSTVDPAISLRRRGQPRH